MVYYQMMAVDSGNLVDEFASLEEAVAAVRDGFERFGQAGVDGALSENDDDSGDRLLGIGNELLHLAQVASPARLVG